MKNTTLLVVGLVGLVAVAFFIGSRVGGRYAWVNGWNNNFQAPAPTFWGKGFRGGMMGHMYGGFRRGGLQGQVTKIEGNVISLQLPNSGTYTVTLDDQTAVSKVTKGTSADLQVGQTISVSGGGPWDSGQTIIVQP